MIMIKKNKNKKMINKRFTVILHPLSHPLSLSLSYFFLSPGSLTRWEDKGAEVTKAQ